ncbi:MAG TPA: outer membrane beta-barrel protein [Steroidobacteraceae bacterium]|nr:outer membrane beta-barrel protein [Steroidobacteraceae bacterium]
MNSSTVRAFSVTALLVAGQGVLSAAEPAAPAAAPAVPSWTDTLTAWGLTANGYVASSYYHSNGYPFNVHQFDIQHDSFQLDQAGLQIAYQPKSGFGALVDVFAGEDARILNEAESGSSDQSVFDVRQAFLQYATGPLTVIAGKYVTLAGAEVINPTQNTNFSRSLIFTWSEPLTHTGVRATWAVTDTLSLVGGANNGWNVTSTSYGSKTGEAGLAWTPSKIFSLTTQAYFGKNQQYDGERTLVDVVTTYNATSALTLILNFDWDQQQFPTGPSATWNGAALYVNYALNDRWRLSLRGEYLDDKDGFNFGGTGQTLKEATLTFGYAPVKSFELRVEGRYDKGQNDVFYRGNPNGANPQLADNLSELALQGVYKFGT